MESLAFTKADPSVLSREQVKTHLLQSGLWPFLKQRPYGILAKPADVPKHIFISGFDSAPLAPDYSFIMKGQEKMLQSGINALAKLTDGKVFLGLRDGDTGVFGQLKNVETNIFSGPHPAGVVGIQIHQVSPINKGELVWTINLLDVLFIGRLFETGKIDMRKIVALTGSEVNSPKYYPSIVGACLENILVNNTKKEVNERIISGNVLTGAKVDQDDYLGFFDHQLTVIPEGDQYEFMGWADRKSVV